MVHNLGAGQNSEKNDAFFNADNIIDMYSISRNEGFGAEVKRRIMLGTYALEQEKSGWNAKQPEL